MSKVSLAGNVSGTGVFTIASPNSNVDRTLTLPDNTGTLVTNTAGSVSQTMLAANVAGNGPAFSAYQSSVQSLTANTITKIQLQAEEFDTASAFDATTNYRFQPTVAGYYQVSGAYAASANRTYNIIYIYKTGSNFKTSNAGNNLTGTGASVSALIYLNGSTDYVELYGLTGVTQNTANNSQDTYFQASLVRAA